MLRELAFSEAPLEAAVKLALSSRGISYSASEVERYASLLKTSIMADLGDDIAGQPWSSYVEALAGESKLEAAVHAFAGTLGASPREANQFIEILNATSDVLDGADVNALEESLAVELEVMEGEDSVQPYAHLEDTSRDERLEHEHRMQTPDPARPEPPHRAEDDEQ